MLYQLSYTPRPRRRLAALRHIRKLRRDVEGDDFTAEVEIAGLGAAELARAGARQGARGDEFDHRCNAGDRTDAFLDVVAQAGAFAFVADAAMDQNRGSFLSARPGDCKGGDVAGLETGQLLDRPFVLLRPMVAAVVDDNVLGAADDEDVAARNVAHIAGVEPFVGRQAGVGRFGIAEIAVHHRRPAAE